MIDREKIINGLQKLHGSQETMKFISDAITLLKEQESIEPEECDIPGELRCGACGSSIMRETGYRFRHCPWCGRKVKWK